MEMCRKVFQEVAGEDESGNGRALSCLMILASDKADVARQYLENAVQGNGKEIDEGTLAEMRSGDQGYEPEVCGAVYMSDVVLSVRLTGDFAVVDLHFEDCVDFDYLRAGELCRKFDVLADTGNPEGEKVDYSLVLSVVPKGEYDAFFVGIDGVWCFISEEPEEICHIIRLVFAREKFGVLTGEVIEDLKE